MSRDKVVRYLEVTGGALLLFSFIVQNYLYERWNERTDELQTAILEQALVGKSVQLNELLYFVAGEEEGLDPQKRSQLRQAKIAEAARKVFFSQSVPALVSDLPQPKKADIMQRLQAGAGRVHDYDTFLAYIEQVNEITNEYRAPGLLINDIKAKRETSREVFLATYVLGAVTLIIGLALNRS